jgi:hypothetical protein
LNRWYDGGMHRNKLSDDEIAEQCGRAVEKIITHLAAGQPLTIVVSEAEVGVWGFPDVTSMRITLEELPKALPEPLRGLLVVRVTE